MASHTWRKRLHHPQGLAVVPEHRGACALGRPGDGGRSAAHAGQALPLATCAALFWSAPSPQMGGQRFALDAGVAEEQLGQRAGAQALEGFPGAAQGAAGGHAACPDHGLALDPQDHLTHMPGGQPPQGAALGRPQPPRSLVLHQDVHRPQGAQPRRERSGRGQPAAQGRTDVVARPGCAVGATSCGGGA